MNKFFNEILTDDEDRKTYRFLSAGQWISATNNELIEVTSSIDDSLVGRLSIVSPAEIDVMITEAAIAQKVWSQINLEERSRILHRAAELLDQYGEEIAKLICLEVGKPIADARDEVKRSVDFIHYTANQKDWAKEFKIKGELMAGGKRKKTFIGQRVPVGVVLSISPFNYPVHLSVSKIAPALLAGNAVIVKGPTQGSVTTLHIVEIFRKAGLLEGVISAVTGRGSEIGDYLVTHDLIDFIAFTGSSVVGKDIAVKAGMTGLLMELGGKDAVIVMPDADVALAAREIAIGAFSYAGQRCTAVKRVFLFNEIADEFLEALIGEAKNLFSMIGDPRDEATQMGPLISDDQVLYAEELIADALKKGAEELLSGTIKGRYLPPIILDKVRANMRLAWEEQFAPVLPIIRVKNLEQAIDLVNVSNYGLGAAVFSRSEEEARSIADSLNVGIVQINGRPARSPDHFPFLGVKDSGIGTQGIGPTIEAMTRIKGTVVNKTK